MEERTIKTPTSSGAGRGEVEGTVDARVTLRPWPRSADSCYSSEPFLDRGQDHTARQRLADPFDEPGLLVREAKTFDPCQPWVRKAAALPDAHSALP